MKIKIAFLVIIFAIIISGQENQKLVLNLEQAIITALENNHDLKKARLDLEKAEEQVREAYGTSLFPSIDGSARYDRAIKRQQFIIESPFFSGRFPAGTKNTLTASVSAEQPLFTGAMFLAVDIAETFAEISEKAEEYSEAELIKQLKQAYYSYLLSLELIDLTELQLKRAEENYKNTKSMFDAGLASEYDKIKANVQYQNLIPAKTEAENQSRLALNNLKIVLGIDLEREIEILDSLVYVNKDVPSFENGLKMTLAQNKLLKQQELQTELQDLNASYQFTQHFPKLNAFGYWQVQAQENDDRAFNNWRYTNSVTVGLSLSVPIFKGWELDSKVEQAEIDYKKALEDYMKTKKSVQNDYENVMMNIGKIEEQIEAYKLAVDETEKGYEIASKRFSAGLGTQIEVTNALVDVSQAKINYLESVYNYFIEHADLDLILGKTASEILN